VSLVEDLRYPIGHYQPTVPATPGSRAGLIAQLADLPSSIRRVVEDLSEEQLDTPYREGGWTVRQVVHHLPDSHLNSYVRFKLALTEDEPTIKPYDESAWARLPDSRGPIEPSLRLLEGLHERWVSLLRSLAPEDFARTYRHPEHGTVRDLDWTLGLYAWHGRHHLAHITRLVEREGWPNPG
jgi:uncharacterized damage-inducible protein DinB